MKITLAQLNYHIGHFEANLAKMVDAIAQAKEEGADLIVFGELATCGYPPRDFLEFDEFIQRSDAAIADLCRHSEGIGIVLGAPDKNMDPRGKNLFNAVYLLSEGKVQYVQHKTLLPDYDIFDEYRYFEPAKRWGVAEYKGKRLALTVCEDIWDIGTSDPLYTVIPLDEMMQYNPDVIINVSASPFHYKQAEKRKKVVLENVLRYKIPLIYVNHCGAQTDLIFDGGSLIANSNGILVSEFPYFEECVRTVDLSSLEEAKSTVGQPMDTSDAIRCALVTGVRDYFQKLDLKRAVLGLSGGIDSAVTAVIAAEALGAGNVTGLLMPSQYSSQHSVDDAVLLAQNLGMSHHIVGISPAFDILTAQLNPLFEGRPADVTEENIQARIRGIYNMAYANKFGAMLLNTTNKSEMAVGYGTLYGDLCGGLCVLGDVYKTQVYALAATINAREEIIPHNSIAKPPSAELRPGQLDTDSLPPYEILDAILYAYIEERKGPRQLKEAGYEEELIAKVLKLVNSNEFKRYQTAPILRVSQKAFGLGRRMPIAARYF
jgi:NAD+ synthase (glutamine-hydrolysing)